MESAGAHPVGRVTRPGVVQPVRMDPAGLTGPTPKATRGPNWRRTSHGFYVPAAIEGEVPEQRIAEAAAVLPVFGGVTGWAALRWHGALWFDGRLGNGSTRAPVTLVTSCHDIRAQPGIAVSHEQLYPHDIVTVDGLRTTSPERSVLLEMRYAGSVEAAVVIADMAMQADLVTTTELVAHAARLGTWTGIPLAREALTLVRENSWSPQETRLRLLWVLLAGLPEPLCNRPVFDLTGRHIGTPDLLDARAGVVGEYEGVVHLESRQRGVDVRREQAFRAVGLEYFPAVSRDWRDEALLAARIRSAYARAVARPAAERRWTIRTPPWWTRTDTVARRRQLTDLERRLWLSRRAG
jgi:hypothetical protein